MITKSRIKSTTDPIVKPVGTGKHKKVLPQEGTPNTTVKNHRNTVPSEPKGVTNSLPRVTSVCGKIEQSVNINNIPGVTGALTGVTPDKSECLAGVTATLSEVTITNSPKKRPVMSDKEQGTQGENSMLQAIARLETKLLETMNRI